eukprot:1153536-Pelagomonas_calceolata.AAC.5
MEPTLWTSPPRPSCCKLNFDFMNGCMVQNWLANLVSKSRMVQRGAEEIQEGAARHRLDPLTKKTWAGQAEDSNLLNIH